MKLVERAATPPADGAPPRRGFPAPRPVDRPMLRTSRVQKVRDTVAMWRDNGREIAFVPTMGAIHDGHLSLVRRAVGEGRRVVASIFVNPLQFGPGEDFERYPRPIARDRALLAAAGVDLLWEPRARDLYPDAHATRVRVAGLGDVLEGTARPGHFEGVTTVVLILLDVVRPDVLWLGQKDAQQALVIERMCRDLMLPVKVRRAPIVRESDGLARSSRNAYLRPREREQAVALHRGLRAAREALEAGERSPERVRAGVRRVWKSYPLVREEYVAIVNAHTLEPVRDTHAGPRLLVAVAARLGATRLIDNLEWTPPR